MLNILVLMEYNSPPTALLTRLGTNALTRLLVADLQGKEIPFLSDGNLFLPSVVINDPVSPSNITNVGIDLTLYLFDNMSPSSPDAASGGNANQGIVEK
jgi:hypothetical protein